MNTVQLYYKSKMVANIADKCAMVKKNSKKMLWNVKLYIFTFTRLVYDNNELIKIMIRSNEYK